MRYADKVKIDVAYVNRYLKAKGISNSEFSEMNGHSHNWWKSIELRCNSMVSKNQAKLICNVTGLDYEKLVIPERKTFNDILSPVPAENENQLIINSLHRLETKMEEAHLSMTRLEIQMKTILKELGVK